MQAKKTRWTHYQIAYHFVWIPKYRTYYVGTAGQVTTEIVRKYYGEPREIGMLSSQSPEGDGNSRMSL